MVCYGLEPQFMWRFLVGNPTTPGPLYSTQLFQGYGRVTLWSPMATSDMFAAITWERRKGDSYYYAMVKVSVCECVSYVH